MAEDISGPAGSRRLCCGERLANTCATKASLWNADLMQTDIRVAPAALVISRLETLSSLDHKDHRWLGPSRVASSTLQKPNSRLNRRDLLDRRLKHSTGLVEIGRLSCPAGEFALAGSHSEHFPLLLLACCKISGDYSDSSTLEEGHIVPQPLRTDPLYTGDLSFASEDNHPSHWSITSTQLIAGLHNTDVAVGAPFTTNPGAPTRV